ncbi:MAG: glycogen debranching enzyme N-terminal domain-containing protein, partial [Bacillota bacterium]
MLDGRTAWLKPSSQEWLEADGLGGFGSSTTRGIHTRRYHGWLFLAGDNPGDRWLALSKLEDTCIFGGHRWDLSSNMYPGCIHPDGEEHLLGFSKEPFPRFVYKLGSI